MYQDKSRDEIYLSSDRSFLLYCDIHPSEKDYRKRKKKKVWQGGFSFDADLKKIKDNKTSPDVQCFQIQLVYLFIFIFISFTFVVATTLDKIVRHNKLRIA